MTPLLLVSGALVALAATILITPFVIRYAWNGRYLDRPDAQRKKHLMPTPTMGGIAIVLGGLIGGGYLVGVDYAVGLPLDAPSIGFWAGAAIILGAGMIDDLRGLNPKTKFLLQMAAAYVLLHAGYSIDLSGFSFFGEDPYRIALVSIPLTMVWIVGVINAVNLLDGLDGLASGVSMIAFAGLATLMVMTGNMGAAAGPLVMVGALAGFLVFNFNPASIFMGDSGSLFLGYLLAAYSLDVTAHVDPVVALLVPVVLLGIPIVDTTVAIVRRFLSGKAVFAPDHDHVHHRLREVFSHRNTVLLLYAVAGWFAVAAVLMALFPAFWSYGLFGIALATSVVGLRLLGYLRAHSVARALRFRQIQHQRRQEAEPTDEHKPTEMLRSIERAERVDAGHKHTAPEHTKPQLLHVEP